MAVKHYVDEIPSTKGRTYRISINGDNSTITDTTTYEQMGTTFGAADVNSTCVLECNYSKSGTVHRLTTDNKTSENIKFYATSSFTRGDIFTFNGVTVTAQTTDGQALGTNFFVAGTVVECFKKGDVLYFGSSSRTIVDDSTGASYRLGIENGLLYIEED